MATSYTTPNMNLVVPVVGQEPGPNWASDLNASLTTIDGHNHSPGSGIQITPAGININADLPFNNSNNAIGLRSVRFFSQASPLSTPSDLGCLYESGVDLYYNDGLGNQIRITQGGTVAGSSGTITGLPSGTASASFQSASGTFVFQQATSTAANLDVGSIIIRYPGSYPTPAGNGIILEAPSSISGSYAIVLPSLPAQTNVMTLGTSGIISSVTFDAVGQTMTSVGANAILSSSARPLGNSAGNFAVSSACGTFTTNSTSNILITNLSNTITTTGKPIFIGLIPDPNTANTASSYARIYSNGGSGGSGALFFYNNTLAYFLGFTLIGLQSAENQNPGAFWGIDYSIIGSPGTYSYSTYVVSSSSGNTITAVNLRLIIYELW